MENRKSYTLVLLILILSTGILFLPTSEADLFGGFIPPTNAFYKIFIGSDPNDNVTAKSYTGNVTLIEGSGISILSDYLLNTLTFSTTGSGTGNATILDELGDVDLVNPAYHSILIYNGTQWTNKLFMLDSKICGGTDKVSAINNITGAVTCSADLIGSSVTTMESLTNVTDIGCATGQVLKVSGVNWVCADDSLGASVLDDLTDVVITAGNYGDILFHNGITWVDRAFMINSKTCSGTDKIISIDNITGAVTCGADIDTSGGITTLESLTNVTNVGCAAGETIISSGGNWICGSVGTTITTLESLTNVTDVGCGDGQVRKASGGNWICADDTDTTGATTLNELTDVTITSPDYKDIIQYNANLGQWIDKIFSINTQSASNDVFITGINNQTGAISTKQFSVNTITCSAGQFVSTITNTTGNTICTAPSGSGITSINSDSSTAQFIVRGGAGNITVTNSTDHRLINTGFNVVVTGGSAQAFTKNLDFGTGTTQKFPNAGLIIRDTDASNAFTVKGNGLSANNTVTIPASTLTSSNFALDKFTNDFNGFVQKLSTTFLMRDSDSTHGITIASPNLSANITVTMPSITSTLAVNKSSATGDLLKGDGTNYIKLARGSNGQVLTSGSSDISWVTPSSGSGVPLPPKKWGTLIPTTTALDVIGLVSGCTILPTASYSYDTSDNSGVLISTTAATAGINGGIHCTATNRNTFRGDQNAYMYTKFEENKITLNRMFIGFSSSATHLPNAADTILDAISGAGLCIRTTDTIYQFCSNDGTGATTYATLTTTEDTVNHYFEVYTTDSGVTWCGKLDGGTAVCTSTAANIPAVTTRMYPQATMESSTAAASIFTLYYWYLQSDK